MNIDVNIPILPSDPNAQIDWLKSLGQQLESKDRIRNLTMIEQCAILYTVHESWFSENEELKIKEEAKAHWKYNFFNWAKAFTQRRGKLPADNTIKNQIGVYRDYIAEGLIEAPATIEIQKYDDMGNAVSDKTETIEIDFTNCDFTKLLAARGTAKKGEMTPKAWSILCDHKRTVSELIAEMKNIGESEGTYLYQQDGIIYAADSNDVVPLAMIMTDEMGTMTWKDGMDLLSTRAKITIEFASL